jgi:hypothetical protein
MYPIGRFISVVLPAANIFYYFFRVYKSPDKETKYAILKLALTSFLLLIPCSLDLAEIYTLIPKPLNIIGRFCFLFGMLNGYRVTIELVTDNVFKFNKFIRTPIFLINTFMITIIITVMVLNKKSISLTNSYYFEYNWMFFVPYTLYYTVMANIAASVFMVSLSDFKQQTDPYNKVRCLTSLLSCIFVTSSTSLACISIFIFTIYGNPYKYAINWLVQEFGRGMGFILGSVSQFARCYLDHVWRDRA